MGQKRRWTRASLPPRRRLSVSSCWLLALSGPAQELMSICVDPQMRVLRHDRAKRSWPSETKAAVASRDSPSFQGRGCRRKGS